VSSAWDKIQAKLSAAADSIESARGVRPRKPKQARELTRQIVKSGSFDKLDWAKARRDPEIDAVINDLYLGDMSNQEERPGYLNGPELIQDVFMTFFRPVPTLHKKRDVVKDARLNGKFVEQMMALTDYERLHDNTATDDFLALRATVLVADAVKEMIKQHREAVEQANEQRQRADNPGGDPGGSGESWDEETPGPSGGGQPDKDSDQSDKEQGGDSSSPGHTDDPGGESGEDEQPKGDDGDADGWPQPDWDHRELEDEQDNAGGGQGQDEGEGQDSDAQDGSGGEDEAEDGYLDDGERDFNEDYADEEYQTEGDWERLIDGADFGRYVSGALKEAADEIEQLEEARKSVGLESGEWKAMDPSARLKMAARLNTPRMKAIADMVGRMKRFALNQQAQKIIDAPHEIHNVEMGNDIRRLLPIEFGLLGLEESKIEFYRRFAEGTLLQFTERGREKVGKGPIIALIDNSGSMSGAPENWAKGVAEALRRICQDQDRDFHAIYFGTNRNRERFDFPKGKGPFEKVMAFLSITAQWGTEFDGVLTESLNKCQTMFDGEGKGKADIVFITDGQARLDQNWIDQFVSERDRIGARIFGIYISAYDSIASSALQLMEKFCTVVIPVKALEVNDDAAATVFSQV